MDALRQIEAFVAVVRAGSYVKGAERQETSKAVLSRQVLELETRLGTRLLNRTTRRLSLTVIGMQRRAFATRFPTQSAISHRQMGHRELLAS